MRGLCALVYPLRLRFAEALPRPVQSQSGSLPRPAEAGHGKRFQLGRPRRTVHGAVPEYAELVKYSKMQQMHRMVAAIRCIFRVFPKRRFILNFN